MDKNRIKGAAKEIAGSTKEAVGKAVGDRKLQAKGVTEKVVGKVQNTAGKMSDAAKHAAKR